MKLRFTLLMLLTLMGIGESFGQLLQWNTFGNTGAETSEPSVFNNPNISSSNLTLGLGITGATNANRFGGTAWFNTGDTNPSTLANAVSGNDYIQFVVTPNSGYTFTPTSFVFNWDKSGTGPQNIALRSSIDGFSTNIGVVEPTATIGVQNTITISGLTNISGATTFRVYGYGATATGGTGGFDIGTNIVNVQLNGTVTSAGPYSISSGDWNTGSTWSTGLVPNATDNVTITAGHTVYTATALTRNGSTTVNGTFQLNAGGFASGTNFTYGTAGTLNFNASGAYGVDNSHVYWPAVNGPINVNVLQNGMQLNAGADRTVSGTFLVANSSSFGVSFPAATLTLNGICQINSNGFFANSPIYGNASTLIYNTGGTYGRGQEWSYNGVGIIGTTPGYPNNVVLSNTTTLNYNNGTPLNKAIAGNLTIDSGSGFYMDYGGGASGGTLTIAGNLTNSGALTLGNAVGDDIRIGGNITFNSGYSFNANNRAVVFHTNGTKTITATGTVPTFHYLNLDPASGNTTVQLSGTDLNITAPAGGNVISFKSAGDIFNISGRTLSLGTAGNTNVISGLGTFSGSATSNLTLLGNGSIGTLRFTTGSQTLGTLAVNRENAVTAFSLGTALSISTSLVLTKGLVDLGANTLTLGLSTSTSGASANSFVISDLGFTGRLRKTVNSSTGAFLYPIGDSAASANGAQYSPAIVNYSGGTISGYVELAVDDVKHPSSDATADYITRYWKLSSSGISGTASYTFTGTYLPEDIIGTESNSIAGRWNGTQWIEGLAISSNTVSFTSPAGATSISTAINEITAGSPLGLGEINVRGNSTDITSGSTIPSVADHTDFGKLCAERVRTFTIQNETGARGALLVSGVTISGANAGDFTITTVPATSVAVGSTTTFQITFSPSAAGLRTAIVNIISNDADENPYTFAIQGTGDSEIQLRANNTVGVFINHNDLDASDGALNNTLFAITDIGNTTAEKIYYIHNLGTRDLILTGTPTITLSGTNSSDFTITQFPMTSTLSSCSGTDFRMTFTPSGAGVRTAIVTIGNSDSDENPYVFAIQGSGRAPEIDITGNNVSIPNTNTSISESDHTLFPNTQVTGGTATRTFTILNTGSGSLSVSEPTISGADAADFTLTGLPANSVATSLSTTFTITFNPTTAGIKNATISIINSDTDENPYTFNIQGKGITHIDCESSTMRDIAIQDFEDSPVTPTWSYGITGTAFTASGTAYGALGDSGNSLKYIGAKSLQFSDSNTDNATTTLSVVEFSDVNTENFEEIELNLRIGAFSVNSTNGLEDLDYAMISISQNGGVSWSDEMKIKGNSNAIWSFVSGDGDASGTYDNNNIVESGKDFGPIAGGPRTSDGYSYIKLSNLPSVSNLKLRITLLNSHSNEVWAIDDVTLKGKTQSTKTWNGANWLDSSLAITTPPTASEIVVINGAYNSTTDGGSIFGCKCEITALGNLTLAGNHFLDIQSDITNNGTVTLENNASLVQHDNFATNTGIISMKRETQPMYRYDFTYWSSPVVLASGFTLNNLSPNTLGDKYFKWNATTQAWNTILNGLETMVPGKGYIVRAPQSYSTNPAITANYLATFVGTQNNGKIEVPIVGGTDKWNLIGNPYPSAVDADLFLGNASNTPIIQGTIYFWTHNSPPSDSIPGDATYNYTSDDYASYNLTGGAGTNAATEPNGVDNTPNGYISAGQSFFIKGITNGHASFDNSMRITGNNSQFFRSANVINTASIEKHRIWLNLTNAQGAFNQALVGYVTDATNDLDRAFDGEALSGNYVSLYSVNQDKKLTIQGRALPFSQEDTVDLGFKATVSGAFKISIDHFDGLFESQNIYLEDKNLDIIHDLKASPYDFTTVIGTFNNRFVLRYTTQSLGVDDFANNQNALLVYTKNKKIEIVSSLENIDKIEIFDLLGRIIYKKEKVNATEFAVEEVTENQQALIVRVTLESGQTIAKKIVYH